MEPHRPQIVVPKVISLASHYQTHGCVASVRPLIRNPPMEIASRYLIPHEQFEQIAIYSFTTSNQTDGRGAIRNTVC